jgi:phosphoribosyl 1,2-cyclic phosphodiesterase
VRAFICGVRGSTPAPGRQFVRYGGNTSCVALAHDGGPPSLLLDAGTGLNLVSDPLDGQPFRGTILLSHLHWDHTHGLPFFPAGDRPDSEVELLLPAPPDGIDAESLLARAMSPPHFPIEPSGLAGHWRFGAIEAGEHHIGGFDVLALDIPHGGGRTFGFRVSDGTATVAYLADHSPADIGPGPDGLGEYHPAACSLAAGADLLLHDSQHTAADLATRPAYGHATVEYAVGLAAAAGVRRLLLFHHHPTRTDDELDHLVAGLAAAPVEVGAAAEGTVIDLFPPGR